MPAYTAILRTLDLPRFAEIFAASARQARQTYFHRHHIRPPKARGFGQGVSHSTAARVAALFATLAERDDDEMAEQILRAWLLGHRPLLAATLDHLQIPHADGLTASDDVGKIAKLGADALSALVATLRQKDVAPLQDIGLYLKYMGAENVDAVLAQQT